MFDAPRRPLQAAEHRVEQRRMEGVRHGQPLRGDAFRLQLPEGRGQRLLGARTSTTLAGHRSRRRDRQALRVAGHEGRHAVPGGKDHRHRAAGRQRLHEPAALGDQPQPVLQAKDAGVTGGRVLADAMTQHGVRPHAPRLPQPRPSRVAPGRRTAAGCVYAVWSIPTVATVRFAGEGREVRGPESSGIWRHESRLGSRRTRRGRGGTRAASRRGGGPCRRTARPGR